MMRRMPVVMSRRRTAPVEPSTVRRFPRRCDARIIHAAGCVGDGSSAAGYDGYAAWFNQAERQPDQQTQQ